MTEFTYTVSDPNGIHARPAGLLVKEAKAFAGKVEIVSPAGKSADLKKLLAVMALAIKQGDTVTVKVDGEGEAAAAASIEEFFKANF